MPQLSPLRYAIICLVATLSALTAGAASAQTQADFFNDSSLQELRLRVNSRDWQTLKARSDLNTYYPADVVWKGITVRNVGIRSRGSGTRNGIKPGLRVDMNRYVANQTLLGLHALVLDNAYTDPTTIRESVTMKLFAQLQVPAPRESHIRLYINDEYVGVYIVVEEINRELIARVFGDPEGNVESGGYLFEYQYLYPYNFEYLGSALEPYAELFEAQTRTTDSVSNLYQPIEEMIRLTNESSDDDFAAAVGRYVDLTILMKYVAIESFLDETDGLDGDWATNNFYLYRFRQSDRAQFIPWDKDHTFQNAETPIDARLQRNVMVRRALATDQFRQVYLQAIAQCVSISEATDGIDPRGWLEREVDRQSSQVADAVAQDPVTPFSFDQFQADVDFMLGFARSRPALAECEASQIDPRFGDPLKCVSPTEPDSAP